MTPHHIWHVSPCSADSTDREPSLSRPSRRQASFLLHVWYLLVVSWWQADTSSPKHPSSPEFQTRVMLGRGPMFFAFLLVMDPNLEVMPGTAVPCHGEY